MRVPTTIDDITPEWLTAALQGRADLQGVRVVSCLIDPIERGPGNVSEMARLTLSYNPLAPHAPRTLIAKLPTSNKDNRAVARGLRLYERENRFYSEIGAAAGIPVPGLFYGAMNLDTNEHIVLLEDLGSAQVGDTLAGCALEEAEVAIQLLARMHALWWENPRLVELTWLMSWRDAAEAVAMQDRYHRSWRKFADTPFSELPPAVTEIAIQLRSCAASVYQELSAPPLTLVHGDFRLDNLLFSDNRGSTSITVIDWQVPARLRGVFDVGTFILSSLKTSERKRHEMDLLQRYHALLVTHGVRGYTFAQSLHDYRLTVLLWLARSIIVAASYDFGNAQSRMVVQGLLTRVAAAVVDLNCGELVPER